MAVINDPNVQKEIRDIFTQAFTQGSFSGTPGNQIQLLFSWPPETLQESSYLNPWTPNNGGSMVSTENISKLVDNIPFDQATYNYSGNSIEDVYSQFILGAFVPGPNSIGKSAALMSENKSGNAAVAVHQDLVASQEKLTDDDTIKEAATQFQDSLENERTASLAIASHLISGITSKQDTATQKTVLDELKTNLASTSGVINDISTQLQAAVSDVQKISSVAQAGKKGKSFSPSQILAQSSADDGMTPNGLTPPPMSPIQIAMYNGNKIFSSTAVASINYPTLKYHPSFINPSGFADPTEAAGWPLLSTSIKDTAGNDVSINLSYTRADITRSWFLGYILSMNGWQIKDQDPGWLSQNLFPLLPVSFILCRNLEIIGSNSSYKVKGLQILAVCCKRNPGLAPE